MPTVVPDRPTSARSGVGAADLGDLRRGRHRPGRPAASAAGHLPPRRCRSGLAVRPDRLLARRELPGRRTPTSPWTSTSTAGTSAAASTGRPSRHVEFGIGDKTSASSTTDRPRDQALRRRPAGQGDAHLAGQGPSPTRPPAPTWSWQQSGTYTMSSAAFGVRAGRPAATETRSVRLPRRATTAIVHAAPWSVRDQGRDVSHGCLERLHRQRRLVLRLLRRRRRRHVPDAGPTWRSGRLRLLERSWADLEAGSALAAEPRRRACGAEPPVARQAGGCITTARNTPDMPGDDDAQHGPSAGVRPAHPGGARHPLRAAVVHRRARAT